MKNKYLILTVMLVLLTFIGSCWIALGVVSIFDHLGSHHYQSGERIIGVISIILLPSFLLTTTTGVLAVKSYMRITA